MEVKETNGPKSTEADLLGFWAANRADSSTSELTLGESGEFTWAYRKGKEKPWSSHSKATLQNLLQHSVTIEIRRPGEYT